MHISYTIIDRKAATRPVHDIAYYRATCHKKEFNDVPKVVYTSVDSSLDEEFHLQCFQSL